ncbi:dTDP-glucose 4,6-dehydratase [Deinococcus sp. QL22]|uniref:dTDP-glucose 4,6-dehydratase n=1 Tax=Deinococcus sp. QL22 TaxID=2939437 RepID=UPI0020181D32|nr:dTDP-glucose 4,6-dehydratase [Deinococcus sp. QL22]UQN09544.1 dTDP-glucose 4,6-dehydratase [Deinococcus sp. QL22]
MSADFPRSLLMTGGCGFIGSNFVRFWLSRFPLSTVVVYDLLTYAGRRENLGELWGHPQLHFVLGDITDLERVRQTCHEYAIDLIVNFAAETHVDQSIARPLVFTETNVRGTHVLLEVARELGIRLHQVSTDEVYGHVPEPQQRSEDDALWPRSPYAASKAAADQLAQAYFITYGLAVTTTRGSNTVGPYQHPEKAVPLFSTNALLGQQLPIYGDGLQQRDYVHVHDHCAGIEAVLLRGTAGEIYNVGTGQDITNLEMVDVILGTLGKDRCLIEHVTDRPGHDRRYSLNVSKLHALGWAAQYTCQQAIAETARWYAGHAEWWQPIRNGTFRQYYQEHYGQRLPDTDL